MKMTTCLGHKIRNRMVRQTTHCPLWLALDFGFIPKGGGGGMTAEDYTGFCRYDGNRMDLYLSRFGPLVGSLMRNSEPLPGLLCTVMVPL